MFIYILIIVILIYLIYNVSYIESYKNFEEKFNDSDLKFIPYSDSNKNNALNSYIIRPKKITKPSGFVSYVLDSNKNYNDWNHVFEFPIQDSRKSLKYSQFIDKNYHSFFRPIITSSKNMYKQYDLEKDLDKYMINDPHYTNMHPKHIQNNIVNISSKDDSTLSNLLTDNKYKHTLKNDIFQTVGNVNGKQYKCPWGFSVNDNNKHKLINKDKVKSDKIACELL